jgi:hypothetical protein
MVDKEVKASLCASCSNYFKARISDSIYKIECLASSTVFRVQPLLLVRADGYPDVRECTHHNRPAR